MKCPVCEAWTEVKDSRQKNGVVRRSRVCGNDHRFSTEERPVPDSRQRKVTAKSSKDLRC
jgi:transcriptional regulator NrdR family protein